MSFEFSYCREEKEVPGIRSCQLGCVAVKEKKETREKRRDDDVLIEG
jgi:hypothetical protein